ncbi:MAG: nitrate/nitrite transporter [Chloroflexota bacterium]
MSATSLRKVLPAQASAQGAALAKLGWLGVFILCASLGLHNGSRAAPVPLIEEFRLRYGVDYAGVGAALGAYTLTYAFAQLAAGVVADRLGNRRLVRAGLLVMAVGSGIFAFASSYPLAVAGRAIMGIAGGLIYVPALSYTLSAFERGERGKAMGFAQSGSGGGIVLAVLLMPPLYLVVGLSGAYAVFPVIALLLVAGLTLYVPDVKPASRAVTGGMRGLLRDRDFWLLFMGFAFIGMLAQTAVMSWMPTYLRREFDFGVAEAGLAGSAIWVGLMLFSPAFGVLADRWGSRLRVMLAGSLLGLVGFLLLLLTHHAWLAILAGLLVSAGMAATIPMQVVYAGERFAAVGAGTAVAIINTGGQLSQSLDGPFYGTLLDFGLGFQTIWLVATVLGIVRIGAVLLLREEPR